MDIPTIYFKFAIVSVFAATVFGAWRMRDDGWVEGVLLGATAGFMFSSFGWCFLTMAILAIQFLFT